MLKDKRCIQFLLALIPHIQSINKSYWFGLIILIQPFPFIILIQFRIFSCLDHCYSFLTGLPASSQPLLISFFSQQPKLSFLKCKIVYITTLQKTLYYLSFALSFDIHIMCFALSFRFSLKCHYLNEAFPQGSIQDWSHCGTSYLFFLTFYLWYIFIS